MAYSVGRNNDQRWIFAVSVSRQKVLSAFNDGVWLTAALVLLVVVITIALSLIFVHAITHSLKGVAEKMEDASQMDINKSVIVGVGRSWIWEVRRIEDSLRIMLIRLREFRAYLPKSIVPSASSRAFDEGRNGGDDAHRARKSPDRTGRRSRRTSGSTDDGGLRTRTPSHLTAVPLETSPASPGAGQLPRSHRSVMSTTDVRLHHTDLAVIALNLEGFTTMSECMDHDTLIAFHGDWVDRMAHAIEILGGVIVDKFQGDRMLAITMPLSEQAEELVSSHIDSEGGGELLFPSDFERESEFFDDSLNPDGSEFYSSDVEAPYPSPSISERGGFHPAHFHPPHPHRGSALKNLQPEERAALIACRCQDAFRSLKIKWQSLGSLHMDVAVTSGEGLVGNMGSDQIRSYSVISRAIPAAIRLGSLCKRYQIRIASDNKVYEHVRKRFVCRPIDRVRYFANTQGSFAFEIVNPHPELGGPPKQEYNSLKIFDKGFWFLVDGRIDEALVKLAKWLGLSPHDKVAQRLVSIGEKLRNAGGIAWIKTRKLYNV